MVVPTGACSYANELLLLRACSYAKELLLLLGGTVAVAGGAPAAVPMSTDQMRPPMRSRPSSTTTRSPADAMVAAADRPLIPAPITTTSKSPPMVHGAAAAAIGSAYEKPAGAARDPH